mmetsp:Transcript_693/g.1281  ORF Transcript_693/g.1281 Transcript_693/m.1281 type:complete len:197 (+) Transcript_693:5147-5737(+)
MAVKMLSRALRRVTASPFMRTERPKFDFVRFQHDGNAPAPITGFWKLDHSYDFGSDQWDYEDHGMHVLHHRPLHMRSFWVVIMAVPAFAFLYFTWMEGPYTGFFFGHYNMNIELNAAKYLNDDEEYHDWDAVDAKLVKMKAAEEAAENEEEEEEEEEEAEESETEAVDGDSSSEDTSSDEPEDSSSEESSEGSEEE